MFGVGCSDYQSLDPDEGAAAQRSFSNPKGFREVSSLLDERPHGLLLWRAVGKLPVVGVAGGWLDERGGIRRASKRTAKLLRQ